MATVCSIDYIGKTYTEKDGLYIAALHQKVEDTLREVGKGVVQRGFNKAQNFRPKSYRTENIAKLYKVINNVNNTFDGKVVTLKKDVNNREYLIVNVNSIAKKGLFFYNDSTAKGMRDNYKEVDGEIVNNSDYDYQKRVNNLSGYDPETIDGLLAQSILLEEKFKKEGISVSVILDGDLNASGAVLSKSNTKRASMVEDGTIAADGFVIAINPSKLQSDTLLHEFGHIFIDLVGGVQNPRVQAAYQKLKSSPLFNEVKELYPELAVDSDIFIKELVNTALGKNLDQVFNTQDEKNWWTRFTDWLNETVGKIFNTDKAVIRSLSNDFLNFKKADIVTNEVNEENYFQKPDPKNQSIIKNLSNIVNSINAANLRIKGDMDKLIADFERRTGQKITSTTAQTAGKSSEASKLYILKELSSKYDTIKKGKEQEFLLSFAKEITQTASGHANYLDILLKDIRTNKNYEAKDKIRVLGVIKHYSNLFSVADTILGDINNMGLTVENKKAVKEALQEATKYKDDILNSYKDIAREIIVDTQSPNFDLIRVEYRDELRSKYELEKNSPISDIIAGETKSDYVDRKLIELSDEIIEKTREFLDRQMRESLDIGATEALLRDEKSVNSTAITMLSRILDEADLKRNRAFMPFRKRASDIHQKFRDKYGSMDQRKMYDAMIDETTDNTYMTGEYKAEFYEVLSDYYKRAEEATAKNNHKKALEINKARKKWFKDNTVKFYIDPITESHKPSDKWKNSKYTKIQADPVMKEMYDFLIEINDLANKNTMGLKTLNKNISGVEAVFRRLPNIGRDTLEKMVGGDYVANTKDVFERFIRYKEDEDDVGEVQDTSSTKTKSKTSVFASLTKGNFNGDERHLVPIYFRNKGNKKTQTYDLMTAYMMNLFMSQNFQTKTEVQGLAEMLVDVNGSKQVIPLAGLKNKVKYQYLTADEKKALSGIGVNSKEYAKLQSMLENRLYGIETIQSEFGKIAETVMGWTGTTMLALNFYSGLANVVQGKVMNFIEGVGGEFFNTKDLVTGEQKYLRDMGAWIADIGSLNNTSKTNLLLDLFDPQGDFKGISHRYIRSNKLSALAQQNTLTFPNKMGEMYIQGTLMYTVLSKIKAKNKNGDWLDKNGKPVKDESKAAGLDQLVNITNGVFTLDESIHTTNFSNTADGNHDKILLETKNLIKKITSDLHGQYDNTIQSHAQRTIFGKMLFMLRKWIIPGIDRRFRGVVHTISKDNWMDFDGLTNEDDRARKFYSQDTKSFREGTYATMIRFLRQLNKEGEMLNVLVAGKTATWAKMTDHEKANIRKWVAEFGVIVMSIISAYVLKGLADDLPEDEAQALYLSAFAFRRLHQELVAYVNPAEALQLMKSPAASISMVQNGTELIGRVFYDGFNVLSGGDAEVYQTGRRKGQLKIAKEFNDVIPILSQTNRNLEDVVDYAFKVY